jgi:hypothetical protein
MTGQTRDNTGIAVVAPALAAQLGAEMGIGPSQIGTYFFVENGAFSAASLLSLFWLGRLNVRIVGLIALAVFVLGNFITPMVSPDYTGLLLMRAVTGFGGGTLTPRGAADFRDPLPRSGSQGPRAGRDIDPADPLDTGPVVIIEVACRRTVEIEDAENRVVADERHDQFGARVPVAENVVGKGVNIFDHKRLPACYGGAADAASDLDAHASRLALKWPEDQFAGFLQEIEAGPVQAGQRLEDQRGGVGGIGDRVALAMQQARKLTAQLVIEGWLVILFDALCREHVPTSCHLQSRYCASLGR